MQTSAAPYGRCCGTPRRMTARPCADKTWATHYSSAVHCRASGQQQQTHQTRRAKRSHGPSQSWVCPGSVYVYGQQSLMPPTASVPNCTQTSMKSAGRRGPGPYLLSWRDMRPVWRPTLSTLGSCRSTAKQPTGISRACSAEAIPWKLSKACPNEAQHHQAQHCSFS